MVMEHQQIFFILVIIRTNREKIAINSDTQSSIVLWEVRVIFDGLLPVYPLGLFEILIEPDGFDCMLVVELLSALHQPRFDTLSVMAFTALFRVFRTLILNIHNLIAKRVILK